MEILDWAFHQLAGSTNDFPVNSLIYICVYWTLTPSGITGTIIITSLFTICVDKEKPGRLQSMRFQRSDATEQQTIHKIYHF